MESEDDAAEQPGDTPEDLLERQLQFYTCLGRGLGCCEDGEGGPLAHVLYFSSAQSVQYRRQIEDFIVGLLSPSSSSHAHPDPTHPDAPPMYQPTAVQTSRHCPCSEASPPLHVTGSVEYYDGYCLDRLGIPVLLVGEELKMQDHLSVVYSQVYSEPFWLDQVEEREMKRLQRMAIKCFNCGDDHHLKDCPEPMDALVIASRRKEFLATQGTPGTDKRYHVTLMEEERFSKFKAGTLSEGLQRALGMQGSDTPPPYLQQMLALGPPPSLLLQQQQPEPTLVLYHTTPTSDKEMVNSDLNAAKPRMGADTSVANGNHEDLGTLSGDYEFEEEETADSEVIGFGLKKLLHSDSVQDVTAPTSPGSDHVTGGAMATSTATTPPRRVNFSVDFPPGLVHGRHECLRSTERWKKLQEIARRK